MLMDGGGFGTITGNTFQVKQEAVAPGPASGLTAAEIEQLFSYLPDPSLVSESGRAHTAASEALADIADSLVKHVQVLTEAWSGTAAQAAVTSFGQLHQTAIGLAQASAQTGAVLSWLGETILPLYKNYKAPPLSIAGHIEAAIGHNPSDIAAQQVLERLNNRLVEANANLPPSVSKNLPGGIAAAPAPSVSGSGPGAAGAGAAAGAVGGPAGAAGGGAGGLADGGTGGATGGLGGGPRGSPGATTTLASAPGGGTPGPVTPGGPGTGSGAPGPVTPGGPGSGGEGAVPVLPGTPGAGGAGEGASAEVPGGPALAGEGAGGDGMIGEGVVGVAPGDSAVIGNDGMIGVAPGAVGADGAFADGAFADGGLGASGAGHTTGATGFVGADGAATDAAGQEAAGGTGFPMTGGTGGSGRETERRRQAWMAEDADVWEGQADTAPSKIST
jgi:hypothetical protein